MISDSIILECLKAGAVILPFMAYEEYVDGNYSESKKIGLRYICVGNVDTEAILSKKDFYLGLETSAGDFELIGKTPEIALEKYERKFLNKK